MRIFAKIRSVFTFLFSLWGLLAAVTALLPPAATLLGVPWVPSTSHLKPFYSVIPAVIATLCILLLSMYKDQFASLAQARATAVRTFVVSVLLLFAFLSIKLYRLDNDYNRQFIGADGVVTHISRTQGLITVEQRFPPRDGAIPRTLTVGGDPYDLAALLLLSSMFGTLAISFGGLGLYSAHTKSGTDHSETPAIPSGGVGTTDAPPATVNERGAPESYLNTAYTEVCTSYHALDDFRMKLLGLLPIASIVGLLTLGASTLATKPSEVQLQVVAYVGVFSALFTLALFAYEMRSILMCHDLYSTGTQLEKLMALKGQFSLCDETRPFACYQGAFKRALARKINGKITPCAVYSLVFAAWLFVGLRYGFNVHVDNCVRWAAGVGLMLAALTSWLLHMLTRSSDVRDDLTARMSQTASM